MTIAESASADATAAAPAEVARPTEDGPDARRIRARYMHGPIGDVALALAWVPFVAAALVLESHADRATLAMFISGVFLLSFAHQPLTVALVYGDPAQFRLRKAIFTWSPLLFVIAIAIGYSISFVLIAIVGALWNAEHTLMQRYGVTRIYGRMAGQGDGRVEQVALFLALIGSALWVAASPDTPARATGLPLGENNRVAIDVLTHLRPYALALLVPVVLAGVVSIGVWVRDETRRPSLNPMKWVYLASTFALFGVIVVNPLAGIMGYVGAHAVEYFVIVHQSLGRRYMTAGQDDGALLGRAVRARTGRWGFLGAYVALVVGLILVLERVGSPLLYTIVFFTLGGMHVFYDGFIWKLRRPAVASSLAIPTAS